jgi:hypothetical protein
MYTVYQPAHLACCSDIAPTCNSSNKNKRVTWKQWVLATPTVQKGTLGFVSDWRLASSQGDKCSDTTAEIRSTRTCNHSMTFRLDCRNRSRFRNSKWPRCCCQELLNSIADTVRNLSIYSSKQKTCIMTMIQASRTKFNGNQPVMVSPLIAH